MPHKELPEIREANVKAKERREKTIVTLGETKVFGTD
jgi:hypothetical protein